MALTPYHAKYFAHELTRRRASDSVEKLASALVDAQVRLNPHQVEAALFRFSLVARLVPSLLEKDKWGNGRRSAMERGVECWR